MRTSFSSMVMQAASVACITISGMVSDALCQPDSMWIRAYPNCGMSPEIVRTFEGGYAIGGNGWDGDRERPDQNFSLIRLDSTGLFEWQRFYSLDTIEVHDDGYGILQMPDSGFVLVGEISGAGGMILRTDADGEVIWWRRYGNIALGIHDCVLSHDGHLVITTGSGITFKLDSDNGDEIWRRNYTIENSGILWKVIKTEDNGFLFTGRISTIGAGGSDMYAVRTDSEGEIVWREAYGTEFTEGSTHATETADGGFCIVGYTNRGGGVSRNTGMVVRVDSEGEEIWRNIFITEEDSIIWRTLQGVVETPDGGFAILRDGHNYSAKLGRLDFDGEMLWEVEYRVGGDIANYAFTLIRFDDFGYLLGGFTGQIGGWLVRTEPDSLSVAAWNLSALEENHDFGEIELNSTATWDLIMRNDAEYPVYIQRVMVDSAGFGVDLEGILAIEAGDEASIPVYFTPVEQREYSTVLTIHTKFGDIAIALSGAGVPLSVQSESVLPQEFTLHQAFPNPFNSTSTISYSTASPGWVSIRVFDLHGRLVETLVNEQKDAGFYGVVWNAADISAGVFLCRMEAGGIRQSVKLLLVR